MDDALSVRGLERLGDLHAQLEKVSHRQRLAIDEVLEGLALHQLHRQEGLPRHLIDLIDRADVGMIERRGGTCLPLESRQRGGIIGQPRRQEFQRHLAAQADVLRLVHDSHAAPTQPLQNAVVGYGPANQIGTGEVGGGLGSGLRFRLDRLDYGGSHRGRRYNLHRGNKPVAASGQRLDEARHVGVVAQGLAKLFDCSLDAVFVLNNRAMGP
jgi:hypothetical protein